MTLPNRSTRPSHGRFARLLAVKFAPNVDVSVGTVSSHRLRTPPVTPPGIWGAHYPEHALADAINYTRTVLLVKGGAHARDYVVLRDQLDAPEPVTATLNQWYMQDGTSPVATLTSNTGWVATVDLGNSTLFIVALNDSHKLVNFTTVRWTNTSEGNEHATGVRLSVDSVVTTDVVSVLYPSGSLTAKAAPVPSVSISGDGVVKITFEVINRL